MIISAIIPTRNRGEDLLILLDSLEAQTRRPDEIVIVDASDPPLSATKYARRLENCPLKVTYIHTAPGACRQRNLGARKSTGDILFFFDDDVVPKTDFIEILEDTLTRQPSYHGGMGTVRATMKRWSPGSLLCRFFLLQHEHGDGRFSWSGMPRHPYGTREFRDTEVMGAGLMALRRTVFTEDRIEFDERLTLSQQDVDFSRRLSRRRKLFFNPRAEVDHRLSPRGRVGAFEQGRRYMFNFRYLYFKNFYSEARWTLAAHWWALAGMVIVAALSGALETARGYRAGFLEFRRMRQGRSEGLFEPRGN